VEWKRGRYEFSEIENLISGNMLRAQLVIDKVIEHLPDPYDSGDFERAHVKGLGFCVSKSHAAFMARSFVAAGIPALAIDSDTPSDARRLARQRLSKGEIRLSSWISSLAHAGNSALTFASPHFYRGKEKTSSASSKADFLISHPDVTFILKDRRARKFSATSGKPTATPNCESKRHSSNGETDHHRSFMNSSKIAARQPQIFYSGTLGRLGNRSQALR
jgi:hypothetical protein